MLIVLTALGAWTRASLPVRFERCARGFCVQWKRGVSLPSPLTDGEALALGHMSVRNRAALLTGSLITPGTRIHIAVVRNRTVLPVSLTFASAARSRAEHAQLWIGGVIIQSFFMLGAMLTLWRGRGAAAWGLTAFALASVVNNGLSVIMAPPLASFWIGQIRAAVEIFAIFPPLYLTVETLARRLMRIVVVGVACATFGSSLTDQIAIAYLGTTRFAALTAGTLGGFAVLALLPVLVLLPGYRHAGQENRPRVRWVLWGTVLPFVSLVVSFAIPQAHDVRLYRLVEVTEGVVVLGCIFAVLRTRLIDVSFVINRALVFALITAALFGVFSLLELALHELAVGEKLSGVLQAVMALVLAMSLSPTHRHVEHWIERVFFSRQRRAVASVRTFAAECAFVEQERRLLAMAVERLAPHCAGVAVYERAQAGYRLRAAQGHSWPQMLDVDDAAFVALRARRREVDVMKAGSALNVEALAFPMTAAESLTGAVVCIPAHGELFAPDVRGALAEAARNLGMSLYVLRNREKSQLVADLADGRIEQIAVARHRAATIAGG